MQLEAQINFMKENDGKQNSRKKAYHQQDRSAGEHTSIASFPITFAKKGTAQITRLQALAVLFVPNSAYPHLTILIITNHFINST